MREKSSCLDFCGCEQTFLQRVRDFPKSLVVAEENPSTPHFTFCWVLFHMLIGDYFALKLAKRHLLKCCGYSSRKCFEKLALVCDLTDTTWHLQLSNFRADLQLSCYLKPEKYLLEMRYYHIFEYRSKNLRVMISFTAHTRLLVR